MASTVEAWIQLEEEYLTIVSQIKDTWKDSGKRWLVEFHCD